MEDHAWLLDESGDADGSRQAFREAKTARAGLDATKSPEYAYWTARLLISVPDPQLRDPAEAVRAARQATKASRGNASYLAVLGAAHFQAGQWQAALETLTGAIQKRPQATAYDEFFLAMTRHHLGQAEEANKAYRSACKWMAANCPDNRELKRLRREAAAVLGLDEGEGK